MNEAITIQVRDFAGCPFAVSAEDGLRACLRIPNVGLERGFPTPG